MQQKPHNQGFTIIEVLIAIAIFALIASSSYFSLVIISDNSKLQNIAIDKITNLQTATLFLDRDFNQVLNQNITLEKNKIKFTSIQNNKLLNIEYIISDKKITRIDNNYKSKLTILDNIKKINIRVLDNENKWHKKWKKDNKRYIKAIEFKWDSKEFSKIIKLVMLSE